MLILFDIDDTLVDHSAAARAAAVILHRGLGLPLSAEEFVARWNDALERHFAQYLAGQVTFEGQRRARVREAVDPALTDDAADRVFADYLAAYQAGWSLFPDVLSCLDHLAPHRLGVVSNGQASQQRLKLAVSGIADRFDCILISEECGCAKPSREIFRRACAMIGESPARSVYVGDRYESDAQAARQAGLLGVWLDRRGLASPHHQGPVIRTLDELAGLVDSDPLKK